jgi:hypothetical protein
VSKLKADPPQTAFGSSRLDRQRRRVAALSIGVTLAGIFAMPAIAKSRVSSLLAPDSSPSRPWRREMLAKSRAAT